MCSCPDPELCKKLNMHINEKLYELWEGKNVDEKTKQKRREIIVKMSKTNKKLEQQQATNPKKNKGCGCKKKKT